MIRIAIVGFGNLGRGVLRATERCDDIEVVAIFTRRPQEVCVQTQNIPIFHYEKIFEEGMKKSIDVAILCGGSKNDIPIQGPQIAEHYNAVCSYDIHEDIFGYGMKVHRIAGKNKKTYMLANGFDPGFNSLFRTIGDAVLPGSKIYTFYGPGVSLGHSNAAKTVVGVKNAKSYTLPVEESVERIKAGETPDLSKRETIWRKVFVAPEDDVDKDEIRREITEMPGQFDEYYTEVHFISEEEMEKNHSASPHGGFVLISGTTGDGNRQIMEFKLTLGSNPEFTGSVLVAYARAAHEMNLSGTFGAYVASQVPLALISPRGITELTDIPFM